MLRSNDNNLGVHGVSHWLFVRLIVVAEKTVVYEKFPIPLINRLEKHFLAMETMLTEDQRELADELQRWAEQFSAAGRHQQLPGRGNWLLH